MIHIFYSETLITILVDGNIQKSEKYILNVCCDAINIGLLIL
jgi:hypothetical protein